MSQDGSYVIYETASTPVTLSDLVGHWSGFETLLVL